MGGMVERLARRLYSHSPIFGPYRGGLARQLSWEEAEECEQVTPYLVAARGNIEEMREPTEAMIVVGAEQVVMITDRKRDFHPVKELWMDMIDAALKE